MRRAARVDDTQNQVVKELKSLQGVSVNLGHDDFLVGFRGKTFWIEWKSEDPYKKNGEFRKVFVKKSQIKLKEEWTGSYQICWTLDQVKVAIGYSCFNCGERIEVQGASSCPHCDHISY